MGFVDFLLALVPLIPSGICVLYLQDYKACFVLLPTILISTVGYHLTSFLVPIFAEYTLKRGLSGKDLCKKGGENESKDIPESMGIVAAIVFMLCGIISQIMFADTPRQMITFNVSLFSICFMILLGFMDDVLDLKWRYKLILPTLATLPLLITYNGPTAMYMPDPLANLLMHDGALTPVGQLLNSVATVDTESNGKIVELGQLFLVFMGLQAVFCTNAINILAGINGIECGQAYVIGASICFFKMYEMARSFGSNENQLFALFMVFPFIATTLGVLKHNWYAANVFVGDTFCYFAGMTFAVIGIHSHFSKTLLLLFIPQILNFMYSLPQLFKLIPCPRHRLPAVDAKTKLLTYSTFPCKASEYKLFKVRGNDETCPNLTILNLILRLFGPMHEKALCVTFLAFQVLCSALAFYIRYFLLDQRSA